MNRTRVARPFLAGALVAGCSASGAGAGPGAASAIAFAPPPPVDTAACAGLPAGVAILGPVDPKDHEAWFDSTGIDLARSEAFDLLAREELPEVKNPEEVLREVERRSGRAVWEGHVGRPLLGLHVGSDGSLLGARLISSSGSPVLDGVAMGIAPIIQWSPAVRNGCPMESWIGLPVGFRLIRINGG